MPTVASLTVVIPARNEENFIRKCVESLCLQSILPSHIFVVDGNSNDETKNEVLSISKDYLCPKIIALDNPACITPIAMNIGVEAARTEFIMIAGAHSTYQSHYIEKCLSNINNGICDICSGVPKMVVNDGTFAQKINAFVLTSWFGSSPGNFKVASSKFTDLLPRPIYRKKIYETIGGYNPNLVRNQDNDFNRRALNAGFKMYLDSTAEFFYYPRSTFVALSSLAFKNGKWIGKTIRGHTSSHNYYHLVPLIFSIYIISLLFFALAVSIQWVLFLPLIVYIAIALSLSVAQSLKKKNLIYIISILIFFLWHFSYGLGIINGLSRK